MHNQIGYAEQWDSEEALRDHVRSDLYRRVLAAMELSRKPPEVSFHFTSDTKGLELIEAMRAI
jgi:quinol monooxygenase YgiN